MPQYSVEQVAFNDIRQHSLLTNSRGQFVHLFITEPSTEVQVDDWVIANLSSTDEKLHKLTENNISHLSHFASKIVASTMVESQVDSFECTNFIGETRIPFELSQLLFSNSDNNNIWIDNVDETNGTIQYTNLNEKRVHPTGHFNLTGNQALHLSKETFLKWKTWIPLKDYVDMKQLNQFTEWLETVLIEFNPSLKDNVTNLVKFIHLKK